MVLASCSARWKRSKKLHTLHLPEVLMRQLAELEVHQDETPKQPIVEDEVNVEVVGLRASSASAGLRSRNLAHLQEKVLESIDDGLLQITPRGRRDSLAGRRILDERILEHVAGIRDLLTLAASESTCSGFCSGTGVRRAVPRSGARARGPTILPAASIS